MSLSDRKEELLARASSEIKDLITSLRGMMQDCVELYEKIRDKAIEEGLTVEDTKMLIGILCDKMNLNSYYKKSFIKMVYPPVRDVVDLAKKYEKTYQTKYVGPMDEVKELDVVRVTKDQIPERIMKHIMRVYQDWYEIKLVDGIPTNIRCDTEPEWAITEDYEQIALSVH